MINRLSRFGYSLAAVAALFPCVSAPHAASASSALRVPDEVAAAATSVAGSDVTVHCVIGHGLIGALGHADWNGRLIEIRPFVCRSLQGLDRAPAPSYSASSFQQAQALLILVHEAVHLSDYVGHRDEALTECRALQLVRETALAIGADDSTARALGHEAMRFHARLPGPGSWNVGLNEIPSYQSPDCHDGGPLDIHPDSGDWPN